MCPDPPPLPYEKNLQVSMCIIANIPLMTEIS